MKTFFLFTKHMVLVKFSFIKKRIFMLNLRDVACSALDEIKSPC